MNENNGGLKDLLKQINGKMVLLYLFIFTVSSLLFGTLIRFIFENASAVIGMSEWHFRPEMLMEIQTWAIGWLVTIIFVGIFVINGGFLRGSGLLGKGLMSGSGDRDIVQGSLENSRFLTDKERDKYFPPFTYETLPNMKNDGSISFVKRHVSATDSSGARSALPGACFVEYERRPKLTRMNTRANMGCIIVGVNATRQNSRPPTNSDNPVKRL